LSLGSAEGAKYLCRARDFAPSALKLFDWFLPGPLAQAITFRAVDADSRSVHTQLEVVEMDFRTSLKNTRLKAVLQN
jgi:hypothetical protein